MRSSAARISPIRVGMNSALAAGVAAEPHRITLFGAKRAGIGAARSTGRAAARAARLPSATSTKYSRFQWLVKNAV